MLNLILWYSLTSSGGAIASAAACALFNFRCTMIGHVGIGIVCGLAAMAYSVWG